jgi:aspartate/methionine/tyrosine aminotransferase
METFLAAKEQIFICNSVVDEEIANQFLAQKDQLFPGIQAHIRANFNTVREWVENHRYVEWVEPRGGCVCFPRIKPDLEIQLDSFYKALNEKYKTFVGPGHWFEMDRRHMRIGYGWPTSHELEEGLQSVTQSIEDALDR